MESMVKLGEVQVNITNDVKTTEDLKVLLRWGWGAEITGKLAFKPSEELKAGDRVKVLIEKVIDVPDPVEEAPETDTNVSQPESERSADSAATEETVGQQQEVPAETTTDTKSA